MRYFAYGSNLDPQQIQELCPDHRVIGRAVLRDHRVDFPRYSERWQGGVGGLAVAHGDSVWGMLYELSEQDLARLDRHEGWRGPGDEHNEYDRQTVTVELDRPDDGSMQRRLQATAYLARRSNPSPPTRAYLDTILRGARHHRLPEEYIDRLTSIDVVEGPAKGRDSAVAEKPEG